MEDRQVQTGACEPIEGLIIDRLLHGLLDGKIQERWEQFIHPLMLHQLGLA